MTDDNNPHGGENDPPQENASTHPKNIADSFSGQPKQAASENEDDPPNRNPKPSFPTRIVRVLWRRRKWRRIRYIDHPGPNWAEITTVILTAGIVLASFVQAFIYWKQAQIMQTSLGQNENSITLGQGQLMVAARNAKTAEDTLKEMKSGVPDTHTLAESTKSSALTAKETLHVSERAYLTVGAAEIDIPKKMVTIPITNTGRIPSGKITFTLYEVTMAVGSMPHDTKAMVPVLDRYKSIITMTSIAPGSLASKNIFMPVSAVDGPLLISGEQKIQIAGSITYNDGFADSTPQSVPICVQNIHHEVSKETRMITCDADEAMSSFKSLDWTGLTSTMNQ